MTDEELACELRGAWCNSTGKISWLAVARRARKLLQTQPDAALCDRAERAEAQCGEWVRAARDFMNAGDNTEAEQKALNWLNELRLGNAYADTPPSVAEQLLKRAERAEAEAERLKKAIDCERHRANTYGDCAAECERLRAELAASSKRVAVLMDRIDKAQAALPTDRDLTGTEAAIAYELAEPVPITNERIKAMCDYATGTMTSKGDGDKELIPSVKRTELQQLQAMLERSGIGHGLRFDPDGTTAVMVECDDSDDARQWTVIEFVFESDGLLKTAVSYEPVEG